MKPLIVHSESSMGWGGQEIRVLHELLGMQTHGFSTALLAPVDSILYRRAREYNIAVYPVNGFAKLNPWAWLSVYKHLRHLKPAVVNTHSSEDSWIVGAIARMLGTSLVIRTRHVSTPISSLFSYRTFPHLILTTSQSITDEFIARGFAIKTVITMPTGIDTTRYQFSSYSRASIRKQLGIENDQILVGNICVLRSWKGLDFFVETAANMPSSFRFILVGNGPQQQNLQEAAAHYNLGNRLIFAGYQEQVEHYFSALDILLYTSYASEGVPQSLLQAVCNGLPVVAVKIPSLVETLQGVDKVHWIEYGKVDQATTTIHQARALVALPRDPPPPGWRERYSQTGMLAKINALYRQWLPSL
ncbi:MAG: glycosyltransferase [Desulfobulbaceae bacterium]|nr:glycosyltransferase [Desulfobulbaceae bacterium]